MVGVNFIGRLGNQLFQYYFLLYLKSKGKPGFYFFPNPHHAYFARYFELGWYHNLTLNSKVYSVLMRIIPKVFPFKQVQIHNFFAPKPVQVQNNTLYTGYYQSDYYVKALQAPPLLLKQKYVKAFREKYGSVFDNNRTVTVHIRRTDYLNYQNRDISLPMDYFQRQLDRIQNLEKYKVFFVSDDPEFVRKNIRMQPNFSFETNNEIMDFQLIQNADIAIISNSTFAWWAAYFSPKNNRVIAPKNWMGFRIGREHPRGIMTEKFEWADVLLPG
jgi:hypothetical protein